MARLRGGDWLLGETTVSGVRWSRKGPFRHRCRVALRRRKERPVAFALSGHEILSSNLSSLCRVLNKIQYAVQVYCMSRRAPAPLVQQSFLLQKSFALITHSAQPQSRIASGLSM